MLTWHCSNIFYICCVRYLVHLLLFLFIWINTDHSFIVSCTNCNKQIKFDSFKNVDSYCTEVDF